MSKANKYRVPRVEDFNATPASKKPKPRIGRLGAILFAVMMLLLVCFAYTMTGDYVFNDIANFTALKNARDFSSFWLNLYSTALSSPLSQQWLKASYAWDLQSFGLSPGWSHAVNICLHLTTCFYFFVLVFRLSWRLKQDERTQLDPYYVAAAATAILACHPLVTGSVAYISGRAGVLGAANYFLALNCFLYGLFEEQLDKAFFGYALFFLFTIIGFTSNVECYSLPLVAAVLILALKPKLESWKEWLIERSWELGMFLLVGLAGAFLLTFPWPEQIDNGYALALLSQPIYIATQLKLVVVYYLKSFVFPYGLTISPPNAVATGFTDPGTIAGAIVIAAAAIAGAMSKQPITQLAAAIFVFTLFPWLVKVQPEVVADYRFYLPLCALALACALPLAKAAGNNFRRTAIAFGVIIAVLGGLTIFRGVEWSSQKQLWKAEIRRNPSDARAHAFRARYFSTVNETQKALDEVKEALRLNPDDLIGNAMHAQLMYDQRDYYRGALLYKKSIDLAKKLGLPEDQRAPFYVELAHCYMEMGNLEEANKAADEAYRYVKGDSFLYFVRGKYQLEHNQPLLALSTFEDGYKRDRTNPDFLEAIAQASLDTKLQQSLPNAYIAAKRALKIRHSSEAAYLFTRASLELGKLADAKEGIAAIAATDTSSPELAYLRTVYLKMMADTAKTNKEKQDYLAEREKFNKDWKARDPGVEKRFHLKLAVKPGEELPPPEILPRGSAQSYPDLKRIDPNIPNILDYDKKKPEKGSGAAPLPVAPNGPAGPLTTPAKSGTAGAAPFTVPGSDRPNGQAPAVTPTVPAQAKPAGAAPPVVQGTNKSMEHVAGVKPSAPAAAPSTVPGAASGSPKPTQAPAKTDNKP